MMKIKVMHRWTPREVYLAYVEELFHNNPGTLQLIPDRRKTKSGELGEKVMRKRLIGGYWGKRNRSRQMKNFWVYTEIRTPDGKSKVVEVINYDRWQAVMNAYFLKARDCIIQGEALSLGGMLGRIEPRHIERNHANRKVNYHETKKQPLIEKPDGTKRRAAVIFFTEDDYIRIAWQKCQRITNERVYEFKPSEGNVNGNGFIQLFSQANMKNPQLRLNYPYYPYIMV